LFALLSLLLVILLFKIGPMHSAKVLPSVTECKKAMMCLIEEIYVLDQLRSGMSYSALGCELNVKESTVRSIQKKEKDVCQSVCETALESAKVISIGNDEAMEKMRSQFVG